MVYELRHYVAAPGKETAMMALMKDHVLRIFGRMGFKVTDYWAQEDDSKHLWYVMKWDSAEAMKKGWERFRDDKEWQAARAGGPTTEKIESFVLGRVPGIELAAD